MDVLGAARRPARFLAENGLIETRRKLAEQAAELTNEIEKARKQEDS